MRTAILVFRHLLCGCLLVGACALYSCGGNSAQTKTTTPTESGTTFATTDSTLDLVEPALLAELTAQPRSVSYTEESLVRTGASFETTLANQLVTTSGDKGRFSPAWTSGTDGLAYAIYQFDISGIDRETVLRYGFTTPPADLEDIWIGLANYENNCWQWISCADAASFNFANYTPYESPSSLMHIAVVVTGIEQVQLSYIRLGEQQLEAALSITPYNGVTPLYATFDSSGSTASYGSIAKYEWDLDGDGVFDVDTGTTSEYTYEYDAACQMTPQVRVTNSLGESAIATDDLTVNDAWARTWGTDNHEYLWDVAVDGTEAIYCVGFSYTSPDGYDLILCKYSLAGEIQWVKKWDAPGDDYGYSIDVDDSDIYVVGATGSYYASGQDLLIQRWDKDGNVIWTRTYDVNNSAYDEARSVDVYRDAVYVAGRSSSTSTVYEGDALLLSFTLDGELNWARSFGGSGGEGATCVCGFRLLFSTPVIYVTGWSYGYGDGDVSLLYATYTEDGEMTNFKSWGQAGTRCYPSQITIGGLVNPSYIVGSFQDASSHNGLLVMQLQGSSEPLAYSIAPDSSTNCYGSEMAIIGDYLYVSGRYSDPAGCLVRLDLDNNLEATYTWDTTSPSAEAEFRGLARFPGNGGVLMPGRANSASNHNFHHVSFEQTALSSTSWETLTLEQTDPSGTITTPTAGSIDLTTDGTIDTGGGNTDALLITHGVL